MPTAASAAGEQRSLIMPAAKSGRIIIRRLLPSDSLEALTKLLHRAYAGQIAMGLRPLAGRQTIDITAKRCASGECYVAALLPESVPLTAGPRAVDVKTCSAEEMHKLQNGEASAAVLGERLIGTILFHEIEGAEGPPWFARPDVDSFSQFAVDPDFQRHGAGRLLLEIAERRAFDCGARELGLSMAEADQVLYHYYIRRGYRFIQHWVWPYTNYRSAILSKQLREG